MTDRLFSIPSVQTGSYPVRDGNRTRPLVDGVPAFRRICEAIEAAQSHVWATVTFMWATFEMPDGRGTALEVLDKAAARGVDVRLIFWRPDAETEAWKRNAFWGSEDNIRLLEERCSGVSIRWDKAHSGFCQHQKSWLIDDGAGNDVAFAGGINLNPHSMASPGHYGEIRNHEAYQNHDVYLEIAGLSTADVRHNFVQRWNEASERELDDGRWGSASQTDLSFPTRLPPPQGDAWVQIQRTIHAGRYANRAAPPNGKPFDIGSGERSVFDQYCLAIEAAQRCIYIENQYVAVPQIVMRLRDALQRGVDVTLLLPAETDGHFRAVAQEQPDLLEAWEALSAYQNFTLAGIAGLNADGIRKPVYVHAKLMLIDDVWATIGSANLHRYSLFGNAEMNASFWNPSAARAFRCELFQEHLGEDVSLLDAHAALKRFREVALENRERCDAGDANWQGLAFALSPACYGC